MIMIVIMGNALLAVLVFCEPCAHGFAQLPPTPTVPFSMPYQPACQSPFGLDDCTREVFLGYCLVYWSVCVCACACNVVVAAAAVASFSEMTPTWPSVIYVILQFLFHCSCPCSSLSSCPSLPLSSPFLAAAVLFHSLGRLLLFLFALLLLTSAPLARSTSGHYIEAISFGTHTHTHIHHQLGSFLIY